MADVIYKFLSVENAFRVMEQHALKVSLIRELNDIYDCEPVLGPAAEEPGYLTRLLTEEAFASVRDTYGLVCFSKSYRSPLLWGHYADQAKGLALGFDPAHLPWPERMDVEYREERPVVKLRLGAKMDQSVVRELMKEHYGVTAREWGYEEEVRYLVDLDWCVPRTRMYFFELTLRALREVIVGPRSAVTPAYVRHFLATHYKGIGVSLLIAPRCTPSGFRSRSSHSHRASPLFREPSQQERQTRAPGKPEARLKRPVPSAGLPGPPKVSVS